MDHNTQYAINYFGSEGLLIHPLYTKWSASTVGMAKVAVAEVKADLDAVLLIYDNIEIISYLSSILRAVALTA
jgi:hypothetical protein